MDSRWGVLALWLHSPLWFHVKHWRNEMPKWFDKENAPQDKAPAGGRSKDTGGKAGSGRVDNRKDPKDDKMTDRKDK